MSCSVTVEKGGGATLTNEAAAPSAAADLIFALWKKPAGCALARPLSRAVYLDGGVEFVTVKKGTVAISLFAMFLLGWFVLMRRRSNNRKTAG